MKSHYMANALISSVAAFFILSVGGCTANRGGVQVGWENKPKANPPSKGGPPPHAPAHGYRAKHVYRYYSSASVYFDVHRNVYFYLEGGNWRMSASLPAHLRVRLGDYVTIEMDSDKPYTQFKTHKKKYPPGQMKEKKKWVRH